MNISAISGAVPASQSSVPDSPVKNDSLLVRTIRIVRCVDDAGAIAVCMASQLPARVSQCVHPVIRAVSDGLAGVVSHSLPSLPPLAGQLTDTLTGWAGAAPQAPLSAVIDIAEATRLLQTPDAQNLLKKLLLPEEAPGDVFCHRLPELAERFSKTAGAIIRACLRPLPQHLKMDDKVLAALTDIIRPALKTVPFSDDVTALVCEAFLAGQVPGTTHLSDLPSVLLANQVSVQLSHQALTLGADILSPLLPSLPLEQPSPSPTAPAAGSGAENTASTGAAAPPESRFIRPADMAVGMPNPDFRIPAYDTLRGYRSGALKPGQDMVLVPAGTSMSFGREMAADEAVVCHLSRQNNTTSAGEFPGGATVTTLAGPGGAVLMVTEKRVTAGSEPLLFAGLLHGNHIPVRENVLQAGDGIVKTPAALPDRRDTPASLSHPGAGNAPESSENNVAAGACPGHVLSALSGTDGSILPTLSAMAGRVDSMVSHIMAPGLRFGALADNPAGEIAPDKQQKNEAFREAWLARNPGWGGTPVMARPPALQPAPAPEPWTLHQEANGTLTFNQHAAVNLDDYALPAGAPVNGTQSTPLRPEQEAACFTIQTPGQNSTPPWPGSRVYRVSRQPFAVSAVLPMALTGPGLEPVALVLDSDSRITVDSQAPQLQSFLSSLYAARGPVRGSVTQGGDGLIRSGINTWCLIDGQPFPVHTEPDGKHVIPAPDLQALSQDAQDDGASLRRLEALALEPVEVERKDGAWQMKPSAENGRSLLTFLAQAGLYGVTAEHGSHTGHGFRHAGMTFPYEREVRAAVGHITLPAVTDPEGALPPVPLDWHPVAGVGDNAGFYKAYSSAPNVNAIRPGITLDTMPVRERAGFVLMSPNLSSAEKNNVLKSKNRRHVPPKVQTIQERTLLAENDITIRHVEDTQSIKANYTLLDITRVFKGAFTRPVESFSEASMKLYEYIDNNDIDPKTKEALRSLAEQFGQVESSVSSLHPIGSVRSSLGHILTVIEDHLEGKPVDRNELSAALTDLLNFRFTNGSIKSVNSPPKNGKGNWKLANMLNIDIITNDIKRRLVEDKNITPYVYDNGKIIWHDRTGGSYLYVGQVDGVDKYAEVIVEGNHVTVKESEIVNGSQQKTYTFNENSGWQRNKYIFKSLDKLSNAMEIERSDNLFPVIGCPGIYHQFGENKFFLRVGQKNGINQYISVIQNGDSFLSEPVLWTDKASFNKGGLSQSEFTYNRHERHWHRIENVSPVFNSLPWGIKKILNVDDIRPVRDYPEVYRTNNGDTYLRVGNLDGNDIYVSGLILADGSFKLEIPSSYVMPEGASSLSYLFDETKYRWQLDERLKGGGAYVSKAPKLDKSEPLSFFEKWGFRIKFHISITADGLNNIRENNLAHGQAIMQATRDMKISLIKVSRLLGKLNFNAIKIIADYFGVSPERLSLDTINALKDIILSLDGARLWLEGDDMSVASVQTSGDEVAFYYPKFNKIFFSDAFFALTSKYKLSALLHESVHARVRENGQLSPDYFYLENLSFSLKEGTTTTFTEQEVLNRQRSTQRQIAKGRLELATTNDDLKRNFITEMGTDDYPSAEFKFKNDAQARIKMLLKNPDTLAALIMELYEIKVLSH